ARIAANTSAGIRSIGYVDTNYQTRPMADVMKDIDDWHTMYPGVSGVLLDRVSVGGAADLCYSAYAYNFAKSKYQNDLIAQNFGTYTSPAYEPYGDIFLNAEMGYALYQTWSLPADGFQDNPAYSNRFWHLIHTTSGAEFADALSDSRNNNAGWVYITDDVMPNPYQNAPTYFNTELTQVGTLPSSTIPNRGVSALPAGCMDMSLNDSSSSANGTVSSTLTLANGSSSYDAVAPNKISFSLPAGVNMNNVSGTNWTCMGTECTYSADIASASSSAPLTANFTASCSYSSGDIGVTATALGSAVDTSVLSISRPAECAPTSSGDETLAETGANSALLASSGIAALLAGISLMYYLRRKTA
ncbi:MAG TPA: spherulation-specific family 4 protein, partial [Candidatus Saccharimonadales bacterium]